MPVRNSVSDSISILCNEKYSVFPCYYAAVQELNVQLLLSACRPAVQQALGFSPVDHFEFPFHFLCTGLHI